MVDAKAPTEGGSSKTPFSEDLFQHVVDLHWPKKAAVQPCRFMLGTFNYSNIFVSGDGIMWINTGAVGDGGTYGGMWCRIGGIQKPGLREDFGRPVFLLGDDKILSAEIIMSYDGISWTPVNLGKPAGTVCQVQLFSYDLDTGEMYAVVGTNVATGDGGNLTFIYSSADGLDWSQSGTIGYNEPVPGIGSQGATEQSMKYVQLSGGTDFNNNFSGADQTVGRLVDGKLYSAGIGADPSGTGVVFLNGVPSAPFDANGRVDCVAYGVGSYGPVFVTGGAYSNPPDPTLIPAVAWSSDGQNWHPQILTNVSPISSAEVTAFAVGPNT